MNMSKFYIKIVLSNYDNDKVSYEIEASKYLGGGENAKEIDRLVEEISEKAAKLSQLVIS